MQLLGLTTQSQRAPLVVTIFFFFFDAPLLSTFWIGTKSFQNDSRIRCTLTSEVVLERCDKYVGNYRSFMIANGLV